MAKREGKNSEKKKIIELAYRNISRAMTLAEKLQSGNIEYTIAHMNVTKLLILINYIFTGENIQLEKTNEAFVLGESLCPQFIERRIKGC